MTGRPAVSWLHHPAGRRTGPNHHLLTNTGIFLTEFNTRIEAILAELVSKDRESGKGRREHRNCGTSWLPT